MSAVYDDRSIFQRLARLLAPQTEAPTMTISKLIGAGAMFQLNHGGYLKRTAIGYRLATYSEKPNTFPNPLCAFHHTVGELADVLQSLPRDWQVYMLHDGHMPADKPMSVMAQTGFMVKESIPGPGHFLTLEEYVAEGSPKDAAPCLLLCD